MDRRAFVRSALTSSVAATAVARFSTVDILAAGHKQDLLQIKGLDITDSNGPVRLRGLNLGGWMLIEDYMIGLPWTEWKIRSRFKDILGETRYEAFFDAFDRAYIADSDIAFIAQQGFNVVRIPFNYRHFESDLAPGKFLESGFQQLDRVIRLCSKYKVWVILDLHAAPGSQARDQNAGSAYGETYFWLYRSFIERTISFWSELAHRYSGNPTIAGYNVLGEPVTSDVPELNEFYISAIQAIRKVDREHIIMLDPNLWAKDITSLHTQLFSDPQTMPAIHPYYQSVPAFDSLTAYPSTVDGKTLDRAALAKTLDGTFDQQRIPRPVMVGEFGVWKSHPQPFPVQLAITRDLVSIFEERGWSWCMWCYKDLRDMGILTVRANTPWRRFLDSPAITDLLERYKALEAPFARNVNALLEATDVDRDTREQWVREVSRDFDAPALDFILHRLAEQPASAFTGMAQSFQFSSCEVHEHQLGVLKPFLVRAQVPVHGVADYGSDSADMVNLRFQRIMNTLFGQVKLRERKLD
jgi:endoglucanase